MRGGAAEEEGIVRELEGLLRPPAALPTAQAGGGGERQQGKKRHRAPHRVLVARATTERGRRGGKEPPLDLTVRVGRP